MGSEQSEEQSSSPPELRPLSTIRVYGGGVEYIDDEESEGVVWLDRTSTKGLASVVANIDGKDMYINAKIDSKQTAFEGGFAGENPVLTVGIKVKLQIVDRQRIVNAYENNKSPEQINQAIGNAFASSIKAKIECAIKQSLITDFLGIRNALYRANARLYKTLSDLSSLSIDYKIVVNVI